MLLLPIKQLPEDNPEFVNQPACSETLNMSIDYYKIIGYHQPWICYYASLDGNLVGNAAFKGKPVNNTVEIAYATFEKYQRQGTGTRICKALVDLALQTDPGVKITARTLPDKNYSTRILEKNSFVLAGTIIDPEDGEVWEWVHQP